MIVIDTSALAAIFFGEADGTIYACAIEAADHCVIAAPTVVEASIVLGGRGSLGPDSADIWLDRFLAAAGIEITASTHVHAQIARYAYRIYGKGRGHPAQLNFGDCFSYALAKALDVPLLFKGSDFSRTDIISALP